MLSPFPLLQSSLQPCSPVYYYSVSLVKKQAPVHLSLTMGFQPKSYQFITINFNTLSPPLDSCPEDVGGCGVGECPTSSSRPSNSTCHLFPLGFGPKRLMCGPYQQDGAGLAREGPQQESGEQAGSEVRVFSLPASTRGMDPGEPPPGTHICWRSQAPSPHSS